RNAEHRPGHGEDRLTRPVEAQILEGERQRQRDEEGTDELQDRDRQNIALLQVTLLVKRSAGDGDHRQEMDKDRQPEAGKTLPERVEKLRRYGDQDAHEPDDDTDLLAQLQLFA